MGFRQTAHYFNPRSRVGNDDIFHRFFKSQLRFQSTFPRGERHDAISNMLPACNFNPRSRVGNDGYDDYTITSDSAISIHVPAWGTTGSVDYGSLAEGISIHVPAWGTTAYRDGVYTSPKNFNPRSRVGNDNWVCYL